MRRPSLPKLPAMRRPSLPKRRRKKPLTPQQAAAAPAPILKPKMPRKLPGKPGKLPPLKLILPAAAAIVVVVLVVVLIGTCGSDEQQNVRDTVNRFGEATREKDYQALCDDLFASSLVEKLRTADQPCEVALRIAFEDVQSPTVEVVSVKVDGDKATAVVDAEAVGQQPARGAKILLVREGGEWRISSRPNEQGSAATP